MEQAVPACVFAKRVPVQRETDQDWQGLRSGLLVAIPQEERPPSHRSLPSPPSHIQAVAPWFLRCSSHRPHITVVEEAAGGVISSLDATISYTLLADADILIASAAGLSHY